MNDNTEEAVELAYDVYVTSDVKKDKCPIIFLHGYFQNKYILKEIAEAMCDITKRKIYCPDLRCHGESPFREEYGMEILKEDLKRFIRDRNLEKVAFVCHSISCTVTYLMLLDMPDAVEKAVMVDHPPFSDYSLEVFYEHVYPVFVAQKKLLESLDPSMTLSAAKRKLRHLSDEAKTERKRLFLKKAAYELIKVGNQFKWKIDYKFLTEYAKLPHACGTARGRSDHEILFIRGRNSPYLTDKKFQAIFKYNPKATLKTIEDATHLLMFEKTEEFLEAVAEFLH